MQRRMRSTSSNGGPPTRSSTWLCWKVLALLCTATTFTAAFTLQMDYKPPVKSSVRKIYDSRFPRDTSPSRSGSTSGSGSGKPRKDELPSRSSSAKSAYAGALNAPLPISGASRMTQSFERRMRDLVLGGKDVVRRSSTVAPTATNTRKLPSNVLTVESLQDYKKVVADEPEKMVAVRFYAPWCKVREFYAHGRYTRKTLEATAAHACLLLLALVRLAKLSPRIFITWPSKIQILSLSMFPSRTTTRRYTRA